MTFENPSALLALVLLPLATLLYIRRAGRREAIVPTLALWKTAAAEGAAEAGRRLGALDLPLILALLTLAAAILAASGPVLPVESDTLPNLLVFVDRSASMASRTESSRPRIEESAAAVRRILNREGKVQLVGLPLSAGPVLRNLSADDAAAQLQSAAQSVVKATDMPLHLPAELARCAGLARDTSAVIVITDRPQDVPPGLGGKPVLVFSHGAPSRNVAIDTFEVSRQADGTLGAFAVVRNYSDRPVETPVELWTDGNIAEQKTLLLPEGGAATFESSALPGGVVEVALRVAVDDDLASDNRAVAIRSGPSRFRVAYVGRGNPFLLRALEFLPDTELAQFTRSSDVAGDFDLRVYDSVTPDALPAGDMVFIDPVGRVGPFVVAGTARDDAGLRATVVKDSPLLQHVDVGALRFRRALKIEATGSETLLAAGEGVALLRWQDERSRVLVIGCGLALSETNWPMLASFPLFWANLVADAAGRRDATQDAPTFALTGDHIVVRQPPDAALSVTGPSGSLPLIPGRGARSSFLALDAGVYTVVGGSAERRYAVNMLHPSESDNGGSPSRPSEHELESLLAPGRAAGVSLWRYLAAAALLLALGFWASASGRGR